MSANTAKIADKIVRAKSRFRDMLSKVKVMIKGVARFRREVDGVNCDS